MRKTLWLGLLITMYALPLSAGIYIGTDATPPQSYQSDANYPTNITVSNNTAGQRNCRLYSDGKGPIPPLTCSGSVAPTVATTPVVKAPVTTTPVVKAPAPTPMTTTVIKTPAPTPTPVVPLKNDQAAQQQPLAHVDTTTTIPPLTKPTTTATATKSPSASVATTTVAKPTPVVAKPLPKPQFTTTVVPGSLKANVERIVAQSHWGTVVWNLPIDYNWQGTMMITAPDVQGALSQLLAEYPVQATFYDENHIVSIDARRAI